MQKTYNAIKCCACGLAFDDRQARACEAAGDERRHACLPLTFLHEIYWANMTHSGRTQTLDCASTCCSQLYTTKKRSETE